MEEENSMKNTRKKIAGMIILFLIMLLFLPTNNTYAVNEPRIVVDSFSITEGQPLAGSEATLSIVLKNLSTTVDVSNILLTYKNSYTEAIYPIEGNSNQIYISQISANSKYQVDIEIGITANFKADLASISILMQYQDTSSNSYNNTALIYLPILQEKELDISGIFVKEKTSVGDNTLVSFNYGNNGKKNISNVRLNIEGDISEEQKTYLIGDIVVGKYDTLDYYVNFQTQGSKILKISFSYNDENGNAYTLEPEEYTVDVSAVSDVNASTDIGGKDNQADLPIKVVCIAGIIAIVVVFLIAMILKKTRKKNKYI